MRFDRLALVAIALAPAGCLLNWDSLREPDGGFGDTGIDVTTKKTATATAGESIEIKLQLEKEPTSSATTTTNTNTTSNATTTTTEPPIVHEEPRGPSHGLRNAGFVVGGIGIAGMGVFAAFAALAQTRCDPLKQACNGGPCDASYNSQIDEGQTFQNIANIALVAGGVAIATGAIMIIAGLSTEKSSPPVTASFVPLQGGGFIGVGRAF